MDQPDLKADDHHAALRGLSRINRLSLAGRAYKHPITALCHSAPARQLRVLDVACGGGDTVTALGLLAERKGLNLSLTGLDISDEALSFARARAEAVGVQAAWVRRDVLADGLPGAYDVVISSLFLHHLSQQDAVSLLSQMAQGAREAVLVQDLIRSWAGLALASVVPRVISRSYVVHTDAVLSARAAYSMQEVRDMVEAAGMQSAKIRRVWPERFLLDWRAPARA